MPGKVPGSGGSRKGRPNRRSQGLLAEIKRQFPNYDPIIHMASVAADESNDVGMRLNASQYVAQYVYPKLKAVDLNIDAQVRIGLKEITDEEWKALSQLEHGIPDAGSQKTD